MRPIFIIALAAFLVYVPMLGNDFVTLDDGPLIFQNPIVQQFSLRNIYRAFSSYDPELYVPLTIVSYQIEHLLFGNNPFVYHLTNLILHVLNSVLVALFVARMFSSARADGEHRRCVPALLCAALFALHPIQVEAVAWAAARKDLLSALFFLLSLFFYLQTNRRYSIFAFLLALLSKVSVITLPFVLLLVDWYGGSLSSWERVWVRVKEKTPYFILSFVFGIIAVLGKMQELSSITIVDRLLLSAKGAFFYLQKIFWPVNLSVIYPQESVIQLLTQEFLIPIVALFLLVIFCLTALFFFKGEPACPAGRDRGDGFRKVFVFGFAFFLLTLLPSFVTHWKHGMVFFASDRYAYLPSIGIFIILGILCTRVPRYHLGYGRSVGNALFLLLPVLAFFTYKQSLTWKNGMTLYENVIRIYPENAFAHNNLGMTHYKEGRWEKALEELDLAIAIDPSVPRTYANRALALLELGREEEARNAARQGTDVPVIGRPVLPDDLYPFTVLSNLLENHGDVQEMFDVLKTAVERGEQYGEPFYNLGLKLQKHGRLQEARTAFRQATERDPGFTDAHYRLAAVSAELGMLLEAMESLERVLNLDPGHEDAKRHLNNLENIMSAG